jgi:hypothetical protein
VEELLKQFNELKAKTSNAAIRTLGMDHYISFDYTPRKEWNIKKLRVGFLVKHSYPFEPPYGFYSGPEIMWCMPFVGKKQKTLALLKDEEDGYCPEMISNASPYPDSDECLFWHWRVQAWRPMQDNLLTYYHVICARFNVLK